MTALLARADGTLYSKGETSNYLKKCVFMLLLLENLIPPQCISISPIQRIRSQNCLS